MYHILGGTRRRRTYLGKRSVVSATECLVSIGFTDLDNGCIGVLPMSMREDGRSSVPTHLTHGGELGDFITERNNLRDATEGAALGIPV